MRAQGLAARRARTAYLYLLPGTILMFIFVVVPVGLSVVMSFFEVESLGAEWVFTGFDNFRYLFAQQNWLRAMGRTILFGGWNILVGTFFGLLLSFCVAKHRFLNAYRYIFYLPSIVSAITMGRLWSYMLNPTDLGFFNKILMDVFGLAEPVNWLGRDEIVPFVVMGLGLYGAGGGMILVLFTTAINNISTSILESAKMEGASGIRIALQIELPQIKPVIVSMTILNVIGAFKNFESLYALAPHSEAVETIAVVLYKQCQGSDGYGVPAAMGIILTLIVVALMSVYVFWPSKEENK